MTAIPLSTITIEGAYDMVVFKLDEMTDEEFVARVQASKVPWVDLQAPGWFSLVPTTEYAKTITEPTKIMDFWRDKMQAVSRFAGFGDTRPRMERCVFDPAAMGGKIIKPTLLCSTQCLLHQDCLQCCTAAIPSR